MQASTFEPDRVVILHSPTADDDTSDPKDPPWRVDRLDRATESGQEKLLTNAFENTKRDIKDRVGVPVESQTLPPLDDYPQLYESAYELLRELGEEISANEVEGDSGTVYINVSSLPKSGALAFSNAASALTVEMETDGDLFQVYYVPPETYIETELLEFVRDISSYLNCPRDCVREYSSQIERELYELITVLLENQIDELESLIDEVEAELVNSTEGPTTDMEQTAITQCRDQISNLQEFVEYEWLFREEQEPPRVTPPPYYDEQSSTRYLNQIRSALNNGVHVEFSNDLRADVDAILNRLNAVLPKYEEFYEWSDKYVTSQDAVFETIHIAEDYISDVEEYGMTRGLAMGGDNLSIAISMPPVFEMRDMELLIMSELAETPRIPSIGHLTERIAGSLHEYLDSFRLNTESHSDSTPEFVVSIAAEVNETDRKHVLDELEDQMATNIRNRLQYNLQSLDEKQYIKRVRDEADERQSAIELSQTGEQWIRTHDVASVCREPMEKVLEKETEKYIER